MKLKLELELIHIVVFFLRKKNQKTYKILYNFFSVWNKSLKLT